MIVGRPESVPEPEPPPEPTDGEGERAEPIPAWEYGFHFRSGSLALDLVATVGERWRRSFERLRTPGDLARWYRACGLVTRLLDVSDADLASVRHLREAIHRLAVAAMAGRAGAPDDVATLNERARQGHRVPHLRRIGHAPVPPPASAAECEGVVALAAIDLLGNAPQRIRGCDAHDCGIIFVDRSRPGTRRWCAMRGCGDKAKSATYRRRATTAPAPGGRGPG
jgi:predicted RNA-binding Zn ribbon-like protein